MNDSSNIVQYAEDKNIVKFELPSYSEVMVLSPYGRLVFSSDSGKNAYILDAESGNLVTTLDWNKGQMLDAAFSPDNTHVAACSYNSSFIVWSAKRGDMICSFKYRELDKASLLAWSPNGTNLACAFSRSICVVDIYKKALIAVLLPKKISSLYAVAWSFDGNRVLSGSNDAICVWNLEKAFENSSTWVGPEKNYLKVPSELTIRIYYFVATSVAFSPDGLLIACGTGRGEVCIVKPSGTYMEILNIDKIAMPNGHYSYEFNVITSLSFSPDGKRIVSAAKDMSICVWDVDTRTCIQIINFPEIKTTKISFCIFENVGNRFGESDSREIIMVASKFNRRNKNGMLYGTEVGTCYIRKFTRVDEKYNLLKLASEGNAKLMSKSDLDLLNKLYKKKTAVEKEGKTLSPLELRMYNSLLKKYDFSIIMHSDLLQRNTLGYLKGEEPTYKERSLDFKESTPTMGYFPEDDKPATAAVVGDTGCFGAMCSTRKGGRKGVKKTRRHRKNKTNKHKKPHYKRIRSYRNKK